jgi:gas vesicle protein
MASNKKWALGAILAAIGGYITGILTAPKSGKETRQDIKDEAVKLKGEAEKKLKQLHTELDKLIAEVKDKAGDAADDAKEAAHKAVAAAEAAKTKVREIISGIHAGEAEDKDLDAAIKDASKALDNLKKYVKQSGK